MSICHLYFISSKISPNRLTPVKVSLEESLNGIDEAVVVFVKEDTKGSLKQHTYIVLFDMIINNNELLYNNNYCCLFSFIIEDFVFQPAVINPFLSKKIQVFKITTTSLLTNEMKKDVTNNLHIWIFTGQERNHVLLPYNSPNRMKLYLIGIFNRLKFPLKVKCKI